MKKFLLLTVLSIALIFSLSVTAFADYDTEEIGAQDADAQEENAAAELYGLILDNSDKIFSALAFFSSLVLAFLYKKGMIPIINTGLSAIKKSTDSFENTASDALTKTEETLSFLTDKFASCVNAVEGISAYVDELTARLDGIKEEKNSIEVFKTVMLSQIDMLYEIFMNSALPQYSKEALGEKIADMKKSIKVGEENG